MSTGSTRSCSMIGGCSVTRCPYSPVLLSACIAWRQSGSAPRRRAVALDIEEANVASVALDEAAPALDVLAHEDREDLVRGRGIVQGDLEQDAVRGVHRGLPQLLVVHLTQALVALDAGLFGQPPSMALAGRDHHVTFAVRVRILVRVVAPLQAVERRLCEVDITGLDQWSHKAEQQCEQQRPDMQAIHISVGHEDDLVIARLGQVEVLTDAGAKARDEGLDLVVGQDLVDPGLLDVEDLAADGQDRLVVRVAPSNRRTAGGVTLDDEDLTDGGVTALAVAQLARQAAGLQQSLAAGGLASLTRRHPGR